MPLGPANGRFRSFMIPSASASSADIESLFRIREPDPRYSPVPSGGGDLSDDCAQSPLWDSPHWGQSEIYHGSPPAREHSSPVEYGYASSEGRRGRYQRQLAGKAQQGAARMALSGLLDLSVVPRARADSLHLFESCPNRSLREVLKVYQEALEVIASLEVFGRRAQGEKATAPLFLKGSLASKAVYAQNVAEAFQGGTDLDLQVEVGPWCPPDIDWDGWQAMTGRAAALWVHSLQTAIHPRDLIAHHESPQIQLIERRFFSTRFAIQGSPVTGSWSLHRLELLLPNGSVNHLDLTATFRNGRPFLSDDAAWWVALPLGDHELQVTSWVEPKRALERVKGGCFSIPDLEYVERGALEKVLVKQSRGQRYLGLGDTGQREKLVESFKTSCSGVGVDWRAAARLRLEAQAQTLEGWERVVFQLQVGQLLPELGWLICWERIEGWPREWEAIAKWCAHGSCEEVGLFLAGLGPWLNGDLIRRGLPPIPLWNSASDEFMAVWRNLPSRERWRGLVAAIPAGAIAGEGHPSRAADWMELARSGPDPDQDARLALGWLASLQGTGVDVEQMAVDCALQIEEIPALLQALQPFPRLLQALKPLERMPPRRFSHMSLRERQCLLLDHLSRWPELATWLDGPAAQRLDQAARIRSVWDALGGMVERGEQPPEHLAHEALHSERPAQRRELDAQVIMALAMEQSHPHVLGWMGALLREPITQELKTREARAWVSILKRRPEVRQNVLDSLWDSMRGRRWGMASEAVRQALLEFLPHVTISPGKADGWWQMVERWSHGEWEILDRFPEEALEQLSPRCALRRCELAWNAGRWSGVESLLLSKVLSDPQEGPAAALRVAAAGWPMGEAAGWRLWQLDLQRDGQQGDEVQNAQRLAQRLAQLSLESKEPPPVEVREEIALWIRNSSHRWATTRRPRYGSPLAAPLLQTAGIWTERWGLGEFRKALIQSWWNLIRTPEARGGASNVWVPVGVANELWWRQAFEECQEGEWLSGLEQHATSWEPHLTEQQRRNWCEQALGAPGALHSKFAALELSQRRRLTLLLLKAEPIPGVWREAAAQQLALGSVDERLSPSERLAWYSSWLPAPESVGLSAEISPWALRWQRELMADREALLSNPEAKTLLLQLRSSTLQLWVQDTAGLASNLCSTIDSSSEIDQDSRGVDGVPYDAEGEIRESKHPQTGDFRSLRPLEWDVLVQIGRQFPAETRQMPLDHAQILACVEMSLSRYPQKPLDQWIGEASAIGRGVLSAILGRQLALRLGRGWESHDGLSVLGLLELGASELPALRQEPPDRLHALMRVVIAAAGMLVDCTRPAQQVLSLFQKTYPAWFSLLDPAALESDELSTLDRVQSQLLSALWLQMEEGSSASNPEQTASREALATVAALALALRGLPIWLPAATRTIETLNEMLRMSTNSRWTSLLQQVQILVGCASWGNRADQPDTWNDPGLWQLTRFALATLGNMEEQTSLQLFEAILAAVRSPVGRRHRCWGRLAHVALCWAACRRDLTKIHRLLALIETSGAGLGSLCLPEASWMTWDAALTAVADIEIQLLRQMQAGLEPVIQSTHKAHRLLELVLWRSSSSLMQTEGGAVTWIALVQKLRTYQMVQIVIKETELVKKGIALSMVVRLHQRIIRQFPQAWQGLEQDAAAGSLLGELLHELTGVEAALSPESPLFLLTLVVDAIRELPEVAATPALPDPTSLPLFPEIEEERTMIWLKEMLMSSQSPARLVNGYRVLLLSISETVGQHRRAQLWAETCLQEMAACAALRLQEQIVNELERSSQTREAPDLQVSLRLAELAAVLLGTHYLDPFLLRLFAQVAGLLSWMEATGKGSPTQPEAFETLVWRVAMEVPKIRDTPTGYRFLEIAAFLPHAGLKRELERWWRAAASVKRPPDLQRAFDQARIQSLSAHCLAGQPCLFPEFLRADWFGTNGGPSAPSTSSLEPTNL